MSLHAYLDENGVHYRASRHDPAYTAQELAAAEHVSGRQVLKPVVVRADGRWVMLALPANYKVDLAELREQLPAADVQLADERALRDRCPDCEPGAEPPIGWMFGMPTLLDESVLARPHGKDLVTFQAGTHEDAVTLSLVEYRRISRAEVAHFGRPA